MKLMRERLSVTSQTIFRIIDIFKRYSQRTMHAYILNAISISIITLLQPWLSGKIVYGLLEKREVEALVLYTINILTTSFIGVIPQHMGDLLEAVVEADLRTDYICSIMQNTYDHNKKGELLNSFNADTSTIVNLGRQILSFSANVIMSVVSGIALLFYQPTMFLVGLISLTILVAVSYRMNVGIGNFAMKKYQLNAEYSELLSDSTLAYEEIRTHSIGAKVLEKVHAKHEELKKTDVLCNTQIEKPGRILDLAMGIIPIAGYVLGAIVFRVGTEKLAAIVTATVLLTNFISKSSFIAYLLVLTEPCRQAIERVDDSIVTANENSQWKTDGCLIGIIEEIQVRGLSFAYDDGDYVLDGVSFSLPGRGFVEISGKSGAGKSTLMKILLKAIPPNKGEVLVNGKSLEAIGLQDWRNRIGYYYQGGNLFNGTIYDNIELFNEKPDLEFVDKIATILNLKRELGDDYLNTLIAEGSGGLSTGQKDRIRLLCIMAKAPQILFLDEPGAHLDEVNLTKLYDYLRRLSKELLVVCIAHDDLIKKYCDCSIILE